MEFIKNCRSCRHGEYGNVKCEHCTSTTSGAPNNWVPIPNWTNADRIRAMNDEELAWELMTWRIETLAAHDGIESHYPNTQKDILEWLKQPVRKEE